MYSWTRIKLNAKRKPAKSMIADGIPDEPKINCDNHGLRYSAFVCQHLNLTIPIGFHEPFDSVQPQFYGNGELNAWCDKCNSVLEQEGEWNETAEAYAQIKLTCDQCFFEIKMLNQ